jgi:hypothetical protein
MKKTIHFLILPLVVVIGFVFTNCESKNETKPTKKPTSIAERKANLEQRKKWEASPEGKKVQASHEKIKKHIKNFSYMEAVITSTTFQRDITKSGPKWLIVTIEGETYMMQYSVKDFEPLKNLKVNDKLIIKSRSAGFSNNHPYLILSGDFIVHNNKLLFKRDFSKNDGC